MPKISIIVPVFRVEKYLPVCLDSLRAQTLRDIEIICVDDGSPDRSRAILNEYAALDSRIVVVAKENGGLSSARNAGIRVASSDYICFVDSDDLLERNACEEIVGAFKTNDCDVVTYGATAFPSHRSNAWIDNRLSPRDVVYDSFSPDIVFEENSHPYAWRTALRRDFLIENQLFFDEDLRFGEDELWHFSVYPRSEKTAFISSRLYRYRVEREDSLMATRAVEPVLKVYDHLRIVEKICSDWYSLGLIDLHYRELLSHIAGFVFRDLLEAPSEGRMALLRFARSILEAYFSKSQVDVLCHDKLYGGMARAILVDGTTAWRFGRKRLLYSFTFRTDPFEFLRAGWRRIWSFGPLHRLKVCVAAKVPMSSREQKLLAADVMAELNDANALAASKATFDFEKSAMTKKF